MTAEECLKTSLCLTYIGTLIGNDISETKQCMWHRNTGLNGLPELLSPLTYVDNHRNNAQSRSPYRPQTTHHSTPISVVITDVTGPEVSPGWVSPLPGSSG